MSILWKKKWKYLLGGVSINIHLMILNKASYLKVVQKRFRSYISDIMWSCTKTPFFLRQPKVRFRFSSKESNLLRSEKKQENQSNRFAPAGMCKVSRFKSCICIGNYHVINCILNKVISKFVFENRRASVVKRIDKLS